MDVAAEPAAAPRRTKRRGRHPDRALSAAFVRSAPPGRHADGNGLYLFVQPTGTQSWVGRRSPFREAPCGGRSHVRRGRRARPRTEARRQALLHKDVAAAIETVRDSKSAQPAVRLAFEFLVLTAARSGEVRLATWDEIDAAGAVWTISAARMKAKREHRVPLCGRGLEILDAARALGDG